MMTDDEYKACDAAAEEWHKRVMIEGADTELLRYAMFAAGIAYMQKQCRGVRHPGCESEQTQQMVVLFNMILVDEPLQAIGAHVRAMLAAERAAVVAECAKVCDERAEWLHSNMHALKAEQSETLAAAIRKLGEKR